MAQNDDQKEARRARSKAQIEKWRQLVAEGKMRQETFDEWTRHIPKASLPERLHPPRHKRNSQREKTKRPQGR